MTLTRFAIVAAAGLALLSPAWAALAPNYQRLAELQAVLAAPEVAGAFGGQPIDRVEFVQRDLYRVTAGRCHLDVAIVDRPSSGPPVVGGRQFDVKPGKPVCQ
jgi:hypothetical protein